jgi:hypothetical protein
LTCRDPEPGGRCNAVTSSERELRGRGALWRRLFDEGPQGFRPIKILPAGHGDQRVAAACLLSREGKMMVDGIAVLGIAFGVLAALWLIVFYGSSYFGPKT